MVDTLAVRVGEKSGEQRLFAQGVLVPRRHTPAEL